MASNKQYFHDHLVLLLLSINAFLAVAGSLFILLRLSTSSGTGYIVQYRASLGINAFKTGDVIDLNKSIQHSFIHGNNIRVKSKNIGAQNKIFWPIILEMSRIRVVCIPTLTSRFQKFLDAPEDRLAVRHPARDQILVVRRQRVDVVEELPGAVGRFHLPVAEEVQLGQQFVLE